MNFVYLSPHFPPNYYQFCLHLNELGVNVLGLADESYDLLRPELRYSLREYFRVNDMHHYDELLRACGYFTHRSLTAMASSTGLTRITNIGSKPKRACELISTWMGLRTTTLY